jgi:DNA-binding CsgD family transcriptional regulator
MSNVEHCDDGVASDTADFDVGRLCQLIRSAVTLTESSSKGGHVLPFNGIPEEVVFDVDVDGSRYILIKTGQVERMTCSLSPREREIVRMVALGHQNKVIAAVLNISSWTVCTHLRRIFTKLGVSSRAAMVAKAADVGPAPKVRAGATARHFGEREPAYRDAGMRLPARSVGRRQATTAR